MARAFNCGPRDSVHANVARRDGMRTTGAAHVAPHIAVARSSAGAIFALRQA